MEQAPTHPSTVGVILPLGEGRMEGQTACWSDLLAMSRRAEEVGFDSIWFVDHLLSQQSAGPIIGVWECWSLLAAVAASTSRVEIGTLVACTAFRNPALVAKMADTVDEISNGRLVLGLGAGHFEREFGAFGFPFDHRASRFEEALAIIAGLLRDGRIDVHGRFYSARDCELRPRGPRALGPPLMVGTIGPRMLRLTARHADIWNVYFDKTGNSPDALPALRARVDEACVAEGRDPATLERSASVIIGMDGRTCMEGVPTRLFAGNSSAIVDELLAYTRQGVTRLQVRLEPNTVESIEQFAAVLRLFREATA
ncbi:MAG TPA: LLM class flavin-dependent oxidoreductase [Thermomicrobiales bacterium]|nr:LLM class flavin-dependent oxidoreductase [Thermomicrobiales bacterium]